MRDEKTSRQLRGWACASGLTLMALLVGCPEEPPPPPACTPGTANCSCDQGNCQSGLQCQNNKCVTVAATAGLNVSDASARACEVLLDDVRDDITAQFGSSVEGRAVREGPRLALAFHAKADAAIAAGSVQLQPGTGSTDLGGVLVTTSRCFDGNGGLLAGASVTLVP